MINRENLIKIGRAEGNTSNWETPDQIGRVGISEYGKEIRPLQAAKVVQYFNLHTASEGVFKLFIGVKFIILEVDKIDMLNDPDLL